MKKFFEKLVEGGLLISGGVTSFTILLIVFFLFKEASGLFSSPVVEEGYVLAVNKSNDVSRLSPAKHCYSEYNSHTYNRCNSNIFDTIYKNCISPFRPVEILLRKHHPAMAHTN